MAAEDGGENLLSKKNAPKIRVNIPNDTTRQLLIECGFKCAVPQCSIQWPTLQHHHIDEDPANNDIRNILMLCPTHHQMVTSKHIDHKTCEMLKDLLTRLDQGELSLHNQTENTLLYTLVSELVMNIHTLSDRKFHQPASAEKLTPLVYPRLLHKVLDQAIAFGSYGT